MKAFVVNETLKCEVRDLPVPEPAPGEIQVGVKACGLCGTDMYIFLGEYIAEYPFVLGNEIAGRVTKAGDGMDVSGAKASQLK